MIDRLITFHGLCVQLVFDNVWGYLLCRDIYLFKDLSDVFEIKMLIVACIFRFSSSSYFLQIECFNLRACPTRMSL